MDVLSDILRVVKLDAALFFNGEFSAPGASARSSLEVIGYHIQAIGGDVGHAEDFIVDDRTWTIQNLLINTRNWLRGKNVLISTQKIERVDWSQAKV